MHSFFVIFSCSVFSALHAKHFEIWKSILWNWWINCLIARSIKWYNISGCSQWIHFRCFGVFLSRKLYFLWSPSLLFIAESIRLDSSGKPTVGVLLKIISLSWIILSISVDELNSIDWLFKSWWWTFLK